MPLNLSLNYNDDSHNTFLRFWQLNYNQFITSSSGNYSYCDGGGNLHIFKPSTSDENVYFDQSKNGLTLKVISSGYQITSDEINYLNFNSSGKLVTIECKKSPTYTPTVTITYNTQGKISTITDDIGRICTITYNGTNIIITKPNNDTINLGLSFNNKVLSQITGAIKQNNTALTTTIQTNASTLPNKPTVIIGGYLLSVTDPNNEKVSFEYIRTNSIKWIKHQVNNSIVDGVELTQKGTSTIVKKYRNNLDIAYEKTIYTFNEEGSLCEQFEEVNNKIKSNSSFNLTPYEKEIQSKFENPYLKLFFSEEKSNYIFETERKVKDLQTDTIQYTKDTSNDNDFQRYLIQASIKINRSDVLSKSKNRAVFVKFFIEDETHYLNFNPNEFDYQTLSMFVNIPKSSSVVIKAQAAIRNVDMNVEICNINIYKIEHSGSHDVINKPTGMIEKHIGNTDWFDLVNCNISYVDKNNVGILLEDVVMSRLDYELSLKSYFTNNPVKSSTSDELFNLWINDGTTLFSNVRNVIIIYPNQAGFNIKTARVTTYNVSQNQCEINYIEYLSNHRTRSVQAIYKDNNSKICYNTFDKYNQIIQQIDSNNIVTTYEYDSQGFMNSVKTMNGESTTPNKMIRTDNTHNIDTTNIILSKRIYIGDDYFEEITNIIKNSSLVASTVLPTGQTISYTYTEDGNKLNKIETSINNIINKNELNYNNNNRLNNMGHHDITYQMVYNSKNDITSFNITGTSYITISYDYGNITYNITKTYDTGYSVTAMYDRYDRLVKLYSSGVVLAYYIYSDELASTLENVTEPTLSFKSSLLRKSYNNGVTTYYNYNDYGELINVTNSDYTENISYDLAHRVSEEELTFSTFTRTIEYEYESNIDYKQDYVKKITNNVLNLNIESFKNLDYLRRTLNVKVTSGSNNHQIDYEYQTGTENTSILINKIKYKKNQATYSIDNITYNDYGNIFKIENLTDGNSTYLYDSFNRLIRENNTTFDKTYTFTYDEGGNITSKKVYNYTVTHPTTPIETITYGYDTTWKDKLISINNNLISYTTTSGRENPTSYEGNILSWTRGTLLSSFKVNGSSNPIMYSYDSNSIRKSSYKVIGYNLSQTTTYKTIGTKIYHEKRTITVIDPSIITPLPDPEDLIVEIMYLYDQTGISGMIYNGNCYHFVKDIHQSIKYILDNNMNIIARYNYDAWGNHKVYSYVNGSFVENNISTFIGNINPFRYCGYYYDVETNLYYVTTRYYNPEWGRFISPDSIDYLDPESINGFNLYAYCNNDPVNMVDPSGHFGILALLGITVATMLIGGTIQLASNALAGKIGNELWRGVAGASFGAGVNALALCLALPTGGASLFIAAGASSLVQTGVDTLESIIRKEDIDWGQTGIDLGLNFITTLVGNYLGSKIIPTNSGWFQPKKFLSVFTKSYGQKILLQTAIGAVLSGSVNFVRKFNWEKYKPTITVPVIPFFKGD